VTMVESRRATGFGFAGETFVRARVPASVSRNTDYVVVGKQPGQKLEATRRLGIPTMGEREFLAMMRSLAA
jgi:DNA ligase (NAD+)